MPPVLRSISIAALLLQALWSVVRGADRPEEGMAKWKATVREKFPTVPQLSTAELARWLAETNRPTPILLDVRTAPEFDVSRIPGARRVDPDSRTADLKPLIGEAGRPVVVYCSVGWRSSALADRLIKAGITNVSNLEGSVFAWANEGRPLENGHGAVTKVHPYNQTFGRLLAPERRADP